MSSIVPIEDVPPYVQSIASAGQTQFDTDFTADDDADVIVYARADGATPDDVADIVPPEDYVVTFVGVDEEVRVTFDSGRTLNDIVTIMRATPVDRLNLYTNTNFTTSMLNGDFGKQTMMVQEREYCDNRLSPKYNNNATVVDVVDTILPVLNPGYAWYKLSDGSGMDQFAVPDGGYAPADGSYVTTTDESADLPNSLQIQNLGTGLTSGIGLPAGTTAQRPTPTVPNIGLRINTTTNMIEYYDHVGAAWVNLPSSASGTYLPLAGGTMAGVIDMDSNAIENLPAPVAVGDAVNKTYADGFLPLAGGTMTGNIVLVGDASALLEPVSLQQLQAAVLNAHAACFVSTTANLAGYVYANGASGVGATLTAGGFGAFTADGESPTVNARIFVPFQTAGAENGIYVLSTVGDGGTAAVLTRASDFDTADEINAGDTVSVVAGTLYGGTTWMMTQTAAITVGTTDITWQQINNTGALLIANNLSDLNNAATARTNLGLGTMSVQNDNAVAITGGTIVGLTDFEADNIKIDGNAIQHLGDLNNQIVFGTDTQSYETGGVSRLDLSDTGVRMGGANSRVTTILDEDNMVSDSATALATQQSIKYYVDHLTQILDSNGNEIIKFAGVAGSVNEITLTNASTGTSPSFSATGDDSDISIVFQCKGAGFYQFLGSSTQAAGFNLYEDTDNGTNYTSIRSPSALANSNSIYTLQESGAGVYITYDTTSSPAWTDFSGSVGFTGFSANPTSVVARYKKIGKTCFIFITMTAGTSNTTGFTITGMPFASVTGITQSSGALGGTNNNVTFSGNAQVVFTTASTTAICILEGNGSGWTAALGKSLSGMFFYETDT